MRVMKWTQTLKFRCCFQLGVPIGLSLLALWSLLGILNFSVNSGSSMVFAAPITHEFDNENGGSVITIGIAYASEIPGLEPDNVIQQINAVQLAISQTNAAGGLIISNTNYLVSLALADSACDPTQAITAANQLLDAGSVAVIGHTCSAASLAAAPIYNAAGVAMVTASSGHPDVTQQGFTTTFRTVTHFGTKSKNLADYFIALDLNRTAILYPQFGGLLYYNPFHSRYTSLGGTVVSSRTITATSDITPALSAIQAEGVDVILTFDNLNTVAGDVSRIAYSMGLTQSIGWLGLNDAFGDDYFLKAGPQAVEGDYTSVEGRRITDMPGYSVFESDYLAAFPNSMLTGSYYPPSGYDTAQIIMEAITLANSTDTQTIRDEIAATSNFTGVVGIYEGFDGIGDIIPQWGRVERVVAGVWSTVQASAEFYPDQGGNLDLQNSFGPTTTIAIGPGTTSEILAITYTLIPVHLSDLTLAPLSNQAVRLESNILVSNPMTLTIEYSDEQVTAIDESTLELYAWNGNQWVNAEPCGGYIRDIDQNILRIVICHFSDYIVLGEPKYNIHLPIILKPID